MTIMLLTFFAHAAHWTVFLPLVPLVAFFMISMWFDRRRTRLRRRAE